MELETTESFPPKPLEEAPKDALARSAVSIILFAAIYYMNFNKDPFHIILLIGVIFIHEMGHLVAMKMYGYKDLKMFFIPFFGALASGTKQNISQKQRAVISLAGPVPGILIGCVLVVISYFIPYDQRIMLSARMFIWINVINLAPISPLDGGKLMENLFLSSNSVFQILFSILSGIGLIYFGIYFHSYILFIIPVLMISGISRMSKLKELHRKLDQLGINYKRSYDELSDREYWLIRREYFFEFSPSTSVAAASEFRERADEKRIIKNVKGILQTETTYDLSVAGKIGFVLFWLIAIGASVYFLMEAREITHNYFISHYQVYQVS